MSFLLTVDQQPKSATAGKAVKVMNPNLNVEAFLDKVGPETEDKYSNAFFGKLDFVVNALDNVQARLYTDSRCVTNQKALFESGTMIRCIYCRDSDVLGATHRNYGN